MEISWPDIEKNITTLTRVEGGFSSAHRGIVTLPDGSRVFVKMGVDDATQKWAKREIETYRFLERSGYPFAAKLLAYNEDQTSFALEPLLADNGWNWNDEWDEERLGKTLEAMDLLASIKLEGNDKDYFSTETLSESDAGWQPLLESSALQKVLLDKLRKVGRNDIADQLDFKSEAKPNFVFHKDTLVHHDIRADNCPWNAKLQSVKLVDWSWTQIGDRRIDMAATLVHVHKSRLDVTRHYSDRLDAGALHWLAGFWFRSAATPIWPGGAGHLRDMQLQSGLTALQLANKAAELPKSSTLPPNASALQLA